MMISLPKTLRCLKNSYGEFNETQRIGPALFPHFDLIFIHCGEVSITLMERDTVLIGEAQAILIHPHTSFCGHATTAVAQASVHHFEWPERTTPAPTEGSKLFLRPPPVRVERDINRLIRLADDDPVPLTDEMRGAVMLLILMQLQRAQHEDVEPGQETQFQSLILWMREHMGESATLDAMAAHVQLSTSHFRALFREQMGVGPGTYFLTLRMKEAARLLRETLLPIKQIGAQVGYREPPHFHRAFKRHHNITPAAYRTQHLLKA